MKRLLMAAVLVGAMVAVLASTALAAAPVYQGFGPGQGLHTPGTGLENGTVPGNGQANEAVPGAGMRMGRWSAGQANQAQTPAAGTGQAQRRGAPEWAGESAEVKALLGLTDEQIQAARLAGKSLVQIAAAKNVNEQTLTSTILAAKQAELQAQVAAGKLTQVQADAMYAHMQAQVPAMINRTATGPNADRGVSPLAGQRMGGRWSR